MLKNYLLQKIQNRIEVEMKNYLLKKNKYNRIETEIII